MKRIYYLVFNALPTSGNPDAERLEGGLAHFWVEEPISRACDAAGEALHLTIRMGV